MSDNQIWNELVFDAMHAASIGMDTKDFEIQCKLVPTQNGKSFFDRVRVAEDLIRTGLIVVEDGCLKLGMKEVPTSLFKELKKGSEVGWKILDLIDHSSRLTHKIDVELIKQIGLDGELAVIEELTNSIPNSHHRRIKHISLLDDSAGFDIQAPSVKNVETTILLEVKTSPRPGDNFTFFISQNEARIARLNENWALVGVVSRAERYHALGFLLYHQFSDYLPVNIDARGRWESAKITIPKEIFQSGLP
jgi:hypothetical protein